MIKTGGVGCVGGSSSLGLSCVSVRGVGFVLVPLWWLVAVGRVLVPFASVGGSSPLAFSGGGALVSFFVASRLGRRHASSCPCCRCLRSALWSSLAGVSPCPLAGVFVPSVSWSVLCASACFLICPCFRGRPPLLGGGNGHDATGTAAASRWRAVCSSCYCEGFFSLRYLGASPSRARRLNLPELMKVFNVTIPLTSFVP